MNRDKWFSKGSFQDREKSFNDLIFKRIGAVIGILASAVLLAGAGPTDGVTLFEKGNYGEARQVLSDAVAKAPDDSQSQFYLGRTYLALEEADQALPHLEKAVQLAPDNAVYYFWLGVSYWALLDLDRELAAYDRALAIDPGLLPAHVYAGHNQLDRGQWEAALGHYITVLQVLPEHPEALYNAGVALKELGREEEALAVWRRFLQHHQADALAVAAARNLNVAGDFSYRAFPVGRRFIVGPSPGFQGEILSMEPQMAETLDAIGQSLQTNDGFTLHFVMFVENNAELAKQRARAAKRFISENFPDIPSERVRVSWFGQAETVKISDQAYPLKESINIFTEKAGGTSP